MKKLKLNKEVISNISNNEMKNLKGGYLGFFTTGCTDGCTGTVTFHTAWRCTKSACTTDCPDTVRCNTYNC